MLRCSRECSSPSGASTFRVRPKGDIKIMSSRTDEVRRFFNETELYLKNRYGIRVRSDIVRRLVGDLKDSSVLDVGCGDGSLSLQLLLNGNRLTLVDVSEGMLSEAERRTPPNYKQRVKFINSDFLRLDEADAFDVVICVGVLAHVESVEAALGKIASLLRPGGRCVLQTTDNSKLVAKINKFCHSRLAPSSVYGYSVNRVTVNKVKKQAALNNLRVVKEVRYSLLLPGMGRLPEKWLYKYERVTLGYSWLSRHGTEAILLLSKN
jgi:ubiquinone/menaquinone biosynthesis C-methylase UbiE